MKKLIQFTMMPMFAIGALSFSSFATQATTGSCSGRKKCATNCSEKSCCSKEGKNVALREIRNHAILASPSHTMLTRLAY